MFKVSLIYAFKNDSLLKYRWSHSKMIFVQSSIILSTFLCSTNRSHFFWVYVCVQNLKAKLSLFLLILICCCKLCGFVSRLMNCTACSKTRKGLKGSGFHTHTYIGRGKCKDIVCRFAKSNAMRAAKLQTNRKYRSQWFTLRIRNNLMQNLLATIHDCCLTV